MNKHRSKPIARCGSQPKPPTSNPPTSSTASVSALAFTGQRDSEDSGVLDVVMDSEDATECDCGIPAGMHVCNILPLLDHCTHESLLVADPGQHIPSTRTRLRILGPRNFEDLQLTDEDVNPSDNSANDSSAVINTANPPQRRIQRVLLMLRDSLQTTFNTIGLCRQYPRRPSFEPDKFIPSPLLSQSCPMSTADTDDAQSPGISEPPYPFANMSIYRLITWMNSGSHQKSETEVMHLVRDVIHAEDFDPRDLDGFSVRRSLRALDNDKGRGPVVFPDDWLETDITLEIPTRAGGDQSKSFSIPGFHFRPLIAVIRSAFADVQASAFHLLPFKRLWKDPLDDHEERVFDELYTSDSWLDAQDDLQRHPREPGCSLERVIAGIMLFSDATHLANFGTAKAWPLYLYFGNLTKYARSAPTSGACHLVGFFPSVGQSFSLLKVYLAHIVCLATG